MAQAGILRVRSGSKSPGKSTLYSWMGWSRMALSSSAARSPGEQGEQALHVVEAADENEIAARLAEDPWASAGLLRIGSIEPWALWLDGRGRDAAR